MSGHVICCLSRSRCRVTENKQVWTMSVIHHQHLFYGHFPVPCHFLGWHDSRGVIPITNCKWTTLAFYSLSDTISPDRPWATNWQPIRPRRCGYAIIHVLVLLAMYRSNYGHSVCFIKYIYSTCARNKLSHYITLCIPYYPLGGHAMFL